MGEIVSIIATWAKAIIYGPAVTTHANRFSDNETFNFSELGGGMGVRNVTFQNEGHYELIIEDVRQVVLPGESFTVFSNARIVNKQFKVSFGALVDVAAVNPRKDGILRYCVDVCE